MKKFIITLLITSLAIVGYSQGVGIGTDAPSAKLHVIANGDANPTANGIFLENTTTIGGDAIMLIQTNGPGAGDPFISLDVDGVAGWTLGIDNRDQDQFKIGNHWSDIGTNTYLAIETSGDVGIGTSYPDSKLDVEGDIRINDNTFYLRGGTDVNHFIRYVAGAVDGPQIQGNKHTAVRSAVRDLGIFVDYNVGTNDWPGLYSGFAYAGGQTGGSFGESVRVVRGRNGDGTLEFMNNGWGRIGGSNGLAFWANGNADGDDAPAMVLVNNGRLGIGTSAPRAALEINATAQYAYSNYAYLANCATGCNGGSSGNVPVSLLANGRIVGTEIAATSDQRLKIIKGHSDSREDLITLMEIKVIDYTMIDGGKDYKKLIAQQVEEIYPQSISKTAGQIPDIYKLTEMENGWSDLVTDLNVGEKIALIFKNNETKIHTVIAVGNGFKIDSDYTGNVFVYGREVDDLRVIDYEAISMLNLSATQELFNQIQFLQDEVENIKNILNTSLSLNKLN